MSLVTGRVYDGTVVDAYLKIAYDSETDLDMIFEINTEDGRVKAKHPCHGDQLDRTKEVVASFGLIWPNVEEIQRCVDKPCRVWIGEYNGKQYGRINVGAAQTNDPDAIERALRKLKGEDDPPF